MPLARVCVCVCVCECGVHYMRHEAVCVLEGYQERGVDQGLQLWISQ